MSLLANSVRLALLRSRHVLSSGHGARTALACGVAVAGLVAGSVAHAADAPDTGLDEIVVTAQKYKSTIQDTPISMSALSGDQLTAAGLTTMVDIAHDIPGLSMRSAGPGLTEFEARGLASNGGASPTVGFYLDEVPLSPPALSQSGKVVIDPNLYDIDRVEVLRGPQGTLYGSGSMGGTIKIVTNQPKLGVFEGSVQGMVSGTQGGDANGSGNLMLNFPLGDTLALRVVVSDLHRSGWLDREVVNVSGTITNGPGQPLANPLSGPVTAIHKDVNTESLYGGRATLLFKPNDDLSITGGVLYQRMVLGGYDLIDSPPGASSRAHFEANFDIPEPISDTVHLYSLNINAHLPVGDLTSASSYWDRYAIQTQDASESVYNTLVGSTAPLPLLSFPYSEADPSHQFSQELRLTSSGTGPLHWTVGAFYSNMTSSWNERGANPALEQLGGIPNGVLFQSVNPYTLKQSALFADGSYKITDTLTLSAGLRWYDYQSKIQESQWGYVTSSVTQPTTPIVTTASDRGYNPRVNLSYQPSATLNTYITAAKGFRPGGANILIPPPTQPPNCAPGSPQTFGPDSVWNYELGEKAKFFNNRLSINSDVYYVKWNSVQQVALLTCGYQVNLNAGDGRSFGPELEITGKITESWTISASGAYTDAKITSPTSLYTGLIPVPSGSFCASGSSCTVPILNVPKETAAISVVYATDFGDGYHLTARASDSYTGPSTDTAFYFGIPLPSYSIASARAAIGRDKWSATLFVDNLTNKVALMTANNTSFQFNIPQLTRYTVNQPRTIGTQVNYKF